MVLVPGLIQTGKGAFDYGDVLHRAGNLAGRVRRVIVKKDDAVDNEKRAFQGFADPALFVFDAVDSDDAAHILRIFDFPLGLETLDILQMPLTGIRAAPPLRSHSGRVVGDLGAVIDEELEALVPYAPTEVDVFAIMREPRGREEVLVILDGE